MQACSLTSLLHFGLFQPSLTDFLHTDTKAKVVKCKASEVFIQATGFGKFDARHRVRLGTAT